MSIDNQFYLSLFILSIVITTHWVHILNGGLRKDQQEKALRALGDALKAKYAPVMGKGKAKDGILQMVKEIIQIKEGDQGR